MNKKSKYSSVENTFVYALLCLKQKALSAFKDNVPSWISAQIKKKELCSDNWSLSEENLNHGAELVLTLSLVSEAGVKNKVVKLYYCYSCVKDSNKIVEVRQSNIIININ
jgi:hypothetical protein